MAREQRVDLPDDFDALLQNEMAVVPSTAFLPRVRQRVAVEDMRAARGTWRVLVPAGALAAAFALAISFGGLTDRVSPPPPPDRPVLQTMAPVPPVNAAPAETPVMRVSGLRRPAGAPRIRSANEPPVIVDERQRAALSAVLRMVQQGRLTEATFAGTVPPSLQPIRNGVVPVGVNALAVSPIEAGGVVQVGTER